MPAALLSPRPALTGHAFAALALCLFIQSTWGLVPAGPYGGRDRVDR